MKTRKTTTAPAPTFDERIADTTLVPLAPEFIYKIRAIASLNNKTADEVYTMWRKYSADCQAMDQSALVSEALRGVANMPAEITRNADGTTNYPATCHVCGVDHTLRLLFLSGATTNDRGRFWAACRHHSPAEVQAAYKNVILRREAA